MIYKTETGVEVYLMDFFHLKGKGIVFTGKITKLPNDESSILSEDLYPLLKGQKLLEKEIVAIELFATLTQHNGRGIGLLVPFEVK